MSQSDKIFGALLVAFIIYITVRGQLAAPNGYLGIFQHSAAPSSATVGGGGKGGGFWGNFWNGVTSYFHGASSSGGSSGSSDYIQYAAMAAEAA